MDDIRSDVHKDLADHVAVSTFVLLPKSDSSLRVKKVDQNAIAVDEDGDLILDRCDELQERIIICHACSTGLNYVGLQVWPGALLLADYILANEGLFNGCMGLEVGAGTGFAGLILVRTARRVFLADHDPAVLRNCQTNVEANQHLFRQGPDVALVREMDLFHAVPSEPGPLKASREVGDGEDEAFSWLPEDVAELADVQVILAADMIYDDDLTEAFMRCMMSFLKPDPGRPGLQRRVLLSTEKRYNFAKYDVAPQPHAYLFLMSLISANSSAEGGMQARRLDTDQIDRRFEYVRSEHLELWELTWSCQ